MALKPLKFCAVCKGRISWGGRLLRVVRKHNALDTCIHRDRWHCENCCYRVSREDEFKEAEEAVAFVMRGRVFVGQ